MADYRIIDISTWPRQSAFAYFKTFELPYFNITSRVDVTGLKMYCDDNSLSFFLSSLYVSMEAIHLVEEFRYRLKGEQLICYDEVEAGSVILMEDNTFGFCYFPMQPTIFEFNQKGKELIALAKQANTFEPKDQSDNVVHYSIIPWIEFTSFQHARRTTHTDTIPKLVFGKIYDDNGRKLMPVSIEVNHAMMDGYHVGKYMELFQKSLNDF